MMLLMIDQIRRLNNVKSSFYLRLFFSLVLLFCKQFHTLSYCVLSFLFSRYSCLHFQRNTNSDLWWWYLNVRRRCGCVCMQFMCKFYYYRIDCTCSFWCGAKWLCMKNFVAFGFCVFVSVPSKSISIPISISIWSAQMYRGKFISINTIIFDVRELLSVEVGFLLTFAPFEIVLK